MSRRAFAVALVMLASTVTLTVVQRCTATVRVPVPPATHPWRPIPGVITL